MPPAALPHAILSGAAAGGLTAASGVVAMALLYTTALVLGIAFCAPPGAVNAETLRRGLARGFAAAVRTQLGSLLGDTVWAVMALLGAAFLVQSTTARLVLGLAGTLLLLRLAWSALRDGWRGAVPAATASGGGDFATGAMLSLANPWAVAFWLGVGGAIVAGGIADPGPGHFAVFLGGFLTGALLWCLAISALAGWGRRLVGAGFFRWLNLGCGLALAYFGVTLLARTLETLLG